MPLPERYEKEVPEMMEIWKPAGYFRAQTGIWGAECEAGNELYGKPPVEQLTLIKEALILSPEEVFELTEASGHETNKLLRKVQSKLPPEAGNEVHRGNTSSDVLDTSQALQTIESIELVASEDELLEKSLHKLAIKHRRTLQVARTHGQHAIPQTFGRQVLGWAEGVTRSKDRLDRAKEVISYGKLSGEVGTNVFITPELEELALSKLGLKPDPAPTQVIGRDRHAEVLAQIAINAGWLGKIANDIRTLAMTDVGELREPFDKGSQQGSSAMPHKRNPELCERIIGLNRQIQAAAFAENGAIELLLERDISHSSTERFTFPDAFGAYLYMSRLMRHIIENLEVFPDRMEENLNRTYGSIYSSRLLNALLDKGVYSRTEGYELVKGLAQDAMDTKTPLLELAKKDKRVSKHFSEEELEEQFDPEFYLKNIDVAFQRAGLLEAA